MWIASCSSQGRLRGVCSCIDFSSISAVSPSWAKLRWSLIRIVGPRFGVGNGLWARSVDVASAREAVLQAIGRQGDAADQADGVNLGSRLDGHVLHEHEVFFPAQHLDGEVTLDGAGVQ